MPDERLSGDGAPGAGPQGLAVRLRERLAGVDDPVLRSMLGDRIAEIEATLAGRSTYEAVVSELEPLYLLLWGQLGYGPGFIKAWDSARGDVLGAHNWAEEEFYAEMDRRRKGRTR